MSNFCNIILIKVMRSHLKSWIPIFVVWVNILCLWICWFVDSLLQSKIHILWHADIHVLIFWIFVLWVGTLHEIHENLYTTNNNDFTAYRWRFLLTIGVCTVEVTPTVILWRWYSHNYKYSHIIPIICYLSREHWNGIT